MSTFFAALIFSCTASPQTPTRTFFYIFRFDPPALMEFSPDFQPTREIPFSVPADCRLLDVHSAPVGRFLLIELNCPNGQTVVFLDTDAGSVNQPVQDTDSHFLAWTADGRSAYLKLDSLESPRIVHVSTKGRRRELDITGWTYDLSARPNTDDLIYTYSLGLGHGSELSLSRNSGLSIEALYKDQSHYISFARYSPDGTQIAFIKIPDSPTPFTVGELWVMDAGGAYPRKLADADAGHGYAANWSPDGSRIAFVKRENPENESANQSMESLISNIYVMEIATGTLTQITQLSDGRVETPQWSPDGNTLAFNIVRNGRIEVQAADIHSGQIRSVTTEPTCCPAWMRK
jgi:dipeptidyl aminopeptidase/acylaminoacyl peptidase